MWWLILLSFAFYIPVVLFADTIPALVALMMPKTVAYLFIVVFGFKYFVGEFKATSLLVTSFTFIVMGLIAGAFYRKFTKFMNFEDETYMSIVHTHTLALGFLAILAMYLLVRNYDKEKLLAIKRPYHIYLTGLTLTIIAMELIGIYEVVSKGEEILKQAALSGISGLGHIVLTVGMVWTFAKIYQLERPSDKIIVN